MRTLIVVDKIKSAIWRLSEMIQRYNEHLFIDILPFHPKRYSQDDLRLFEEKAKDADLIHFMYWKNALILLKRFPSLRDKPKILTHHNPYDLHQDNWKDFNAVVVHNKTQLKELPGSFMIPHAVDLNFFKYNSNYTENKVVGMVAFRIEGHKGIKEVAQACKELGYKFLLVGRISKPNYFKEIIEVNPETDFREDVSDEELRGAYKEMAVLVCNSVDNFESGPLVVLEAMATGVPVLTRNIGLVPDVYNEKNMVVRSGQYNDLEDLKNELKVLMENREIRLRIRENAWQTVKNMSAEHYARRYAELYNMVLFEEPLVSVIIPTYNRKEQVAEILKSLDSQTYQNIEAVVVDDNSIDGTESVVKQMRERVRYPIKFLETGREGYNLAMARNMGAIEAEGKILLFCDDRLKPHSDAVYQFAKQVLKDKEKIWYFGDKGSGKQSFVENFSAIRRSHFINAGMLSERMDRYGGITQEVSLRFRSQGFKFRYVPFAKAKEIKSSRAKKTRKDDIYKMKLKLFKMYGK